MPDNEYSGVIVVETPGLLAFDGVEHNRRQGFLGRLLHDTTKWMIHRYVDSVHKKMKPVIEYKIKTGWINEQVEQLYKDWTWVIELDKREEAKKFGGFRGPADKNLQLFEKMRDIACVILDEDTHYSMRAFMFLAKVNDGWDTKYADIANRANVMFRYKEIYFEMKERTKPLPKLDDIKPRFDEDAS